MCRNAVCSEIAVLSTLPQEDSTKLLDKAMLVRALRRMPGTLYFGEDVSLDYKLCSYVLTGKVHVEKQGLRRTKKGERYLTQLQRRLQMIERRIQRELRSSASL